MASLSTTGNDIRSALAVGGNSLEDEDDILLNAINWAIRAAWPADGMTEYATSVATLTSGQFDYSLSAVSPALDRHLGVSFVFIQETDTTTAPDVSHDVQQYYDYSADAWTIRFPPWMISRWAGQAVNIMYQHPHADVTALNDSIFIDLPLMVALVERWVTKNMLAEQNLDKSSFERLYDRVFQEERIRRQQIAMQQFGGIKTIHYPQRTR